MAKLKYIISVMLIVLLFSSCSLTVKNEPTTVSSTTVTEHFEEETLFTRHFLPDVIETTAASTTEEPLTVETTTEIETTTEKEITTEESTTLVPYSKDDDEITRIAKEVINGKWSVEKERKKMLEKAGYNYDVVQDKVNEILGIYVNR